MGSHSLAKVYQPLPKRLRQSLVGKEYPVPDFTPIDPNAFVGYRIALVTSHGPELPEFHIPLVFLREQGAVVDIATQDWLFDYQPGGAGIIVLAQWLAANICVQADKRVSEVDAVNYDAVLTIGGAWNPIALRTDESTLKLIRDAYRDELLIVSICHGPQLLISSETFPTGTRATGVADIQLDMRNSGFDVVDEPVVFDQPSHLLTCRDPGSLGELCEELAVRLLQAAPKSA